MAEAPTEPIRVRCTCGVKLRAPAKAAGRRIKCPKCGVVLEVPAAEPAAPETYDLAGGSDPGALLDQLAAQARSAPTESPAVGQGQDQCPACSADLPADAQLCVKCGFDLRSGRAFKAAKAHPGRVASAAKQAASATGRTALGVVLSAGAALIGAVVWYAVAAATEYEIGWIAWGIGILAGAGMLIGRRGPSGQGAVLAAGIAALGIVAGKLMVFNLVVLPEAKEAFQDIDMQREFVAGAMTAEQMEKQGVTKTEWDGVWDQVHPEAEGMVAEMGDEEVRRLAERYLQETPIWSELFYDTMFGLFDIIFFLLALGSAFKLAGSGFGMGGD